jgi:hypothetical protein
MIARHPFARKEAWFVIDAAVSAYMTEYFNAAINLLILVLIALPMIIKRNEFTKKD